MNSLNRICVYCGSSQGTRPEYMESATQLGASLAAQNIELVYGGANVGLMGAVANGALKQGGKAIGVIPKALDEKVGHPSLSELHVVENMHERKNKMFELADGFIALPGGLGTLEEVFEILTWGQLGFHEKPCGVLNIAGYYDSLLGFLQNATAEGFIKSAHAQMLLVDSEASGLIQQMRVYQKPSITKW